MRAEFARSMLALFQRRSDLVFITADLGYRVFEALSRALGERFVNAGVAEQNAVALAAGLALEGQLPWVYNIAAFGVLRPYAQIRDTVCLHDLPVKLVGNGGGYGYGIMGASHHALEDVGALRALPNLRIYTPTTCA
jgi:transketolase